MIGAQDQYSLIPNSPFLSPYSLFRPPVRFSSQQSPQIIRAISSAVVLEPESTCSFLYEGGWHQNFNRSGFPGPDEEFTMVQEYFKPVEGVLMDVSWGSGLFSRKFAKSGAYSKVVAFAFSENMLYTSVTILSRVVILF